MSILSRIKTWSAGETLTASDLNAEFNNIVNSLDTDNVEDASANATAMQATADPYPAAAESLATDLRGEIQRMRYLIKQITGEAQWYIDPDTSIATIELAILTGKHPVELKVFADDVANSTGNSKLVFCIPSELTGMNLVDADAFVTTVSSSGTITVQVRNATDASDMLTTEITIDATEFTSYTAAAPAVIDTAGDDVVTGDLIAIDVDGVGTGSKGLGVILTFKLP